jgi:hypothetical protein
VVRASSMIPLGYVGSVGLEEEKEHSVDVVVVDGPVVASEDLSSVSPGGFPFVSEERVKVAGPDAPGVVEDVDVAWAVVVGGVAPVDPHTSTSGAAEHLEGFEKHGSEGLSVGVPGESVDEFIPGCLVSAWWEVAGGFDEVGNGHTPTLPDIRTNVYG